ncbi:MAG: TRAP transporter small permease [Proteobacteria bacterium]|nr:TRAP transporter small permease [Pseudomonadota bacterium]
MSGGSGGEDGRSNDPARSEFVLERLMAKLNIVLVSFAGLALVGAAGVLTHSVVVRYFLKIPTDWQDETAVFLLIGATFLSAGWVQSWRGHIGIDALASVLPPAVNQVRRFLVDVGCLGFCAFFTTKCWALLHEAFSGDYHSDSSLGPPLWIPYSLLSVGMTLLTLQIALQVIGALVSRRPA